MTKLTAPKQLSSDPASSRYLAIVAAVFTLVAIYGSLVPLQYRALSWQDATQQFRHINFAPLSAGSRTDWVTNILLFVPIGYFWLGSLALGRSHFATALWAILLLPVLTCLSVAIEFTQLWFPPRVPSLNDIMAESLGAAVGAIAWLLTGRRAAVWVKQYSDAQMAGTQIQWLLQAYLVGFVAYSLLPLDLTISVSELFRKIRDGRIQLVPFVYAYESRWDALINIARDVLLAIPVGYLCTISKTKKPNPLRGSSAAWLIALALLTAIELAQVFVYSRVADATDILWGSIGAAIGIGFAYRVQGTGILALQSRSPTIRLYQSVGWSLVAIVYAAGLIAILWAPYDFLQDGEQVRQRFQTALDRVPGDSLYAGMPFNAVVQMLARLVVYALLGAIIVFWSRSICDSKTGRWIALGIGFIASGALATLIELGQVLLPGRIADFSEVPICLAGSALGIGVVWRLLSATSDVREPITPCKPVRPNPLRMTPTAQVDRVAGMDGLRAIACLAVFAVHLQQMTGVAGTWGPFDLKLLMENGNTGVALFFMLSGALLSAPLWLVDFQNVGKQWASRYTLRRLLRILPAYYACLAAIIIWRGGNVEFLNSLLQVGLLHNYHISSFYSLAPSFWTIAVQAQFYVLLPLLFWMLARRVCSVIGRGWVVAVLAVATYGLHYWLMESLAADQRTVVYTHSVLAHLPHLLLGVFVGQYLTNVNPAIEPNAASRRWLYDGLVIGIAVIMLAILGTPWEARFHIPHGRYHFPYVPILIGLAIAAVPRSAGALWLLERKPIRFVGSISFGIYVYHYSLMQLTAKTIRGLGATSEENWLAFAAISLVLTLAVATASYRWLELPLFRWFARENNAVSQAESSTVPPKAARKLVNCL